MVQINCELFKTIARLNCADTVEASVTSNKAYSQGPRQAGGPEASGGRQRAETVEQMNMLKCVKDHDAIAIL